MPSETTALLPWARMDELDRANTKELPSRLTPEDRRKLLENKLHWTDRHASQMSPERG